MKRTLFSILVVCLCATLQAVSPSGTLPVLYIQTENNTPITSEEEYINATYYLVANNMDGVQNIGSKNAPLTMEIKGRGNYTWWGFDKKPYRLKLTDKQPLMGMKKNKHFALMAHADDSNGFMRNALGFKLSKMLGLAWTPDDKPLEVVLNGDYIGLYFLTEHIRVEKDRVNIEEQDDEETNSYNITGGWLVEIDNYEEPLNVEIWESCGYRMWFTYKSPEILSAAQEAFLQAEMERIDRLVYGDKNSDELWKYVDMDALAKFYIVQEIMDNYESFHGSCYLHRDRGNDKKWVFGPVWDFGTSFNRTKNDYMYNGMWHQHWIPAICQFPAFMEHVKTLWSDFYANRTDEIYNFIDQQKSVIASAAVNDAQRWSRQGYGNSNMNDKANEVKDIVRHNIQWLNDRWSSNNDGGNDDGGNDDGGNNDGGNDDGGNDDGGNPEYKEQANTYMLVWKNGEKVEYNVTEVDSITFVEKEEGIVIKVKVPKEWESETIYVYTWDDVTYEDQDVPAMKQGDWYVYSTTEPTLNIIFKMGKKWDFYPNQTEDLVTNRSGCYILTQEEGKKAVYNEVDCE